MKKQKIFKKFMNEIENDLIEANGNRAKLKYISEKIKNFSELSDEIAIIYVYDIENGTLDFIEYCDYEDIDWDVQFNLNTRYFNEDKIVISVKDKKQFIIYTKENLSKESLMRYIEKAFDECVKKAQKNLMNCQIDIKRKEKEIPTETKELEEIINIHKMLTQKTSQRKTLEDNKSE